MRPACKRVHRLLARVHGWQLWQLPRWLVAFVLAVICADLAAIAVAASAAPVRGHDLLLFGLLLLCDAATVEVTRRTGENSGYIRDVYGVWELPVAILLSPLYALLLPAVRIALVQGRVRRGPAHRRVYSAAVIGLAFGCASVVFHALARVGVGSQPTLGGHAVVWVLAVALCGVLEWAVNHALVLVAVKGSDPTVRVREATFAREPLFNDTTELCVAVVVTLGVAISPVVPLFAFPFVSLLQRSLRHSQLVSASRVDSKTGLLNAGTWEAEASTQVVRAARTSTPLAVALLDIDHFKLVNDTHGHLVGDQVLKGIAQTLQDHLREYDLAGRFGGEEFVLLLPQTGERDALRIADRLRAHIGGMPVCAGEGPAAEIVRVTVSVGVAAMDTTHRDLTDLLAAADAALYQAKQNGRDQVQMIAGSAANPSEDTAAAPSAGS